MTKRIASIPLIIPLSVTDKVRVVSQSRLKHQAVQIVYSGTPDVPQNGSSQEHFRYDWRQTQAPYRWFLENSWNQLRDYRAPCPSRQESSLSRREKRGSYKVFKYKTTLKCQFCTVSIIFLHVHNLTYRGTARLNSYQLKNKAHGHGSTSPIFSQDTKKHTRGWYNVRACWSANAWYDSTPSGLSRLNELRNANWKGCDFNRWTWLWQIPYNRRLIHSFIP